MTGYPMAVYAGTKFAVRAISEGLRQEAGENMRVTVITPGIVNTNLADSISDPNVKAQISEKMAQIAFITRCYCKRGDVCDKSAWQCGSWGDHYQANCTSLINLMV